MRRRSPARKQSVHQRVVVVVAVAVVVMSAILSHSVEPEILRQPQPFQEVLHTFLQKCGPLDYGSCPSGRRRRSGVPTSWECEPSAAAAATRARRRSTFPLDVMKYCYASEAITFGRLTWLSKIEQLQGGVSR
ncbi:hypothetical protein E2C01_023596 [Portunus trituberculatus]|uniref:Uncharacterized protein n=1 Tax=Portunus trituberculatus TaxID=210409 RepID=A0A5B7EAG5_PORTR|nr:hypothetical protein [Portunus trituberculatus]